MNFYKFSKITIFLITGILLACTSEKQEQTKINTSQEKITINTNGLKIYKDPVTGEFLQSPPKDYVIPDKTSKKNTNNNIATPDSSTDDNSQISENPDGYRIIKTPTQ